MMLASLRKPEGKETAKETKKIRGQEQREQRKKRKEETETRKEDKVGFEKLLTQNLKALKLIILAVFKGGDTNKNLSMLSKPLL